MRSRQRWQGWPPRLIQALSPPDRARFLAARSALIANTRMAISTPIARHNPTPLGPTSDLPEIPDLSRSGCFSPLSPDCQVLQISYRWTTHCFFPSYAKARRRWESDYDRIVDSIFRLELPHCLTTSPTPAMIELARRIQLAVSILMRSSGIDVPMPMIAFHPPQPLSVPESWARALLTGWP